MRFDLLAKRYLFVEHSQWSPTYANKYVMSYINPVKEPQNWTIPLKIFACLAIILLLDEYFPPSTTTIGFENRYNPSFVLKQYNQF